MIVSQQEQALNFYTQIINQPEPKYQYIWNKFGSFYTWYDNSSINLSILTPVIDTGNDFLDRLFGIYPNMSEKQWEYWHRLVDEIYYFNETAEGKEHIRLSNEAIYWFEIICKDVKIPYPQQTFIRNFRTSILTLHKNKKPLSRKQIEVVDKLRLKYQNQLSHIIVGRI